MGLIELLSILTLFTLVCVGVALFIFALIGIHKVYSDYQKSKWEKEYGAKLAKDTKRNEWEHIERLRDRNFLLEEVIKKNGTENHVDKINMLISEVNYDSRYNDYKKNEAKWKAFALSSMVGGFGSSEKAQTETQEDFEKYDKQRKRELRERFEKMIDS